MSSKDHADKLWRDDQGVSDSTRAPDAGHHAQGHYSEHPTAEEALEVTPLPAPGVDVSKYPPPNIPAPQDPDVKRWVVRGYWVNVQSSNVAAIRYDLAVKRLDVRFKWGAVYEYYAVPVGVAAGLFCADSVGKYHHARIINGGYGYVRAK